jgi:hypothetical protein
MGPKIKTSAKDVEKNEAGTSRDRCLQFSVSVKVVHEFRACCSGVLEDFGSLECGAASSFDSRRCKKEQLWITDRSVKMEHAGFFDTSGITQRSSLRPEFPVETLLFIMTNGP